MGRYTEGSLDEPSAGSDWSFVPSSTDSFRLTSIYAKFTTSATVASRTPRLTVTSQSGADLFAKATVSTIGASVTTIFSWSSGAGPATGGSTSYDGTISDGVPDWWMPPNTTIKIVTGLLQAADQWFDIAWTALIDDERGRLERLVDIEEAIARSLHPGG